MPGDRVVVDPARLHVADEHVILQFRGPRGGANVDRRADRGAAVRVRDRRGRKAEAIVRLAKARIIRAAQELVDRRAMAVGAEEIAAIVPAQAERIHLAPCVALDARAVEPDAIRVAALDFQLAAIASAQRALVVEAVRAVEPAVRAATERREVAVRVALPAERAVEHFTFVCLAVAVGVFEQPDIRDAPDGAFPGELAVRIF